jgi:hypothetical protein
VRNPGGFPQVVRVTARGRRLRPLKAGEMCCEEGLRVIVGIGRYQARGYGAKRRVYPETGVHVAW